MSSFKSNTTQMKDSSITSFKDFNVKELLFKYLKHWYWFVICFVVFSVFTYTKLRYSTPLYDVTATILISQEENLTDAGLSNFKDLGLEQTQDKIENEIQILKSKTLIKDVVTKLNLNIKYFYKGRVIDIEEYLNPIIRVQFLDDKDVVSKRSGNFTVKIESSDVFSFIDDEDNVISSHKFKTPVQTKLGNIIINPTQENLDSVIGKIIKIRVTAVRNLVDSYRARLNIMVVGKNSSVLQLGLRDAVIPRAKNFINNLIDEYSRREINNKNQTSKKTGEFINDRLVEITQNLSNVDGEVASYMSKFQVSDDVNSQSKKLLDISLDINKEITNFETQKLLIQSTINIIKSQEYKNNVISNNLSLDDASITTDIGKYNILVLKRKRLLKTSSESNPIIIKIDDELAGLREVMYQNLKRIQQQLSIKLDGVRRKKQDIEKKLSQAPSIQKDLREIMREQGVTEKLYLYLLEKKEEADITSHITIANSRIIDRASAVSLSPVAPNKKSAYLLSLILSILVPFSVIYLKEILNTNIKSKKDVESLISAPIIGSIPKEKSNKRLVIDKTNNTPISEAFRILRSNLSFLLKGVEKDKGKVIFVTSSVSGEGKTFTSSNVAKSLAILDKKVIYLGSDFRLPKFHEIFELPNGKDTIGFTNYIIDSDIIIDQIIYKEDELYIIPPGLTPPNPTSLLMDDRVKILFEYLETNFDYVVVDTAPISLVTDTLLISEFADLTIHVVKENFSDKRLLTIPERYSKEGRLINLSILINFASSNMSGAYGYGYGYNFKKSKFDKFKFFK